MSTTTTTNTTNSNHNNNTTTHTTTHTASVAPVALIGGSSFLESKLLSAFTPLTLSTRFGSVVLYHNPSLSLVFIQRHAADPFHPYTPPHLINKRAIMAALMQLRVKTVIAFGSVGSLNVKIPVGTLLIPDDYYDIYPTSMFDYENKGHLGPNFDDSLRAELLSLLSSYHPLSTATYCQTTGPRFETKAEIRALQQIGDIVGMTCAHEAALAQECGIRYAVICMVDNLANGLEGSNITYEEFKAGVHRNLQTMESILGLVIQHIQSTTITVPATIAVAVPAAVEDEVVAEAPGAASVFVQSVDSILHVKYVLPMDDAETVLEDHCVVIDKGLIVAILPTNNVSTQYTSYHTEHFSSSVLIPGLINCHTHTGMTLMRGYADDYCLHDWLTQHIWPAEAEFVTPAFVHDSTQLALAEMIRSGCTTMNDMYWHPEIITQLVDQVGTRAVIGLPILDFPSAWATTIDEYINKGLALRASYPSHPRITFAVAPHAPYTVCDENMEKVRQLSLQASSGGHRVHTHLHETQAEVEHSVAGVGHSRHRSKHNRRPLHNLHRLELVNNELIAVHMTHLNHSDIELLAHTQAHVVHCPSSNLKLASGFCPVHQLVSAGVNVGLGTDSTASNNSLDMWKELRLAALLAKGVAQLATAIPAYTALRLATIEGAKVLGIEHITGSLTVGKHADVIAVNLDCLDALPMYDVVSHLVYASDREHVTDVWVQGRRLLQHRQLTTINEQAVKTNAKQWQQKLLAFKQLSKRKREDLTAAEREKERVAGKQKEEEEVMKVPVLEVATTSTPHSHAQELQHGTPGHHEHLPSE